MPDDNVVDQWETIEQVVSYVHDCVYQPERVNLDACFSRDKNKRFIHCHRYFRHDIIGMLASVRVEDYCFTSRVTGDPDAYVFSPDNDIGIRVFLKLTIENGVVVISLHESERELDFPFRKVAR